MLWRQAGTTVAGGTLAGTQVNERLELRNAERAELARLLDNDRNYRDQLRPWSNAYHVYADYEQVDRDENGILSNLDYEPTRFAQRLNTLRESTAAFTPQNPTHRIARSRSSRGTSR